MQKVPAIAGDSDAVHGCFDSQLLSPSLILTLWSQVNFVNVSYYMTIINELIINFFVLRLIMSS